MPKNHQNKQIMIHFKVKKKVEYGWGVYVIGNVPEIGCWYPNNALKLSWNQSHIWTGSISIQSRITQEIEFKYIVALWWNPSTADIQWEAGKTNRKIQLNQSIDSCLQEVKVDHTWNMENIALWLIVPSYSDQYYFVNGNAKELGQWRECKEMKKWERSPQKTFPLLKNGELEKFLQKNTLLTYEFKIYRGAKEIHYYYIKKGQKVEVERIPGRKLRLMTSTSTHPRFLGMSSINANIHVFEEPSFNQFIYSHINEDIILGPYIKNISDLEKLKNDQVSTIFSIQSDQDYAHHYVSAHYLSLLCRQLDLQFNSYSILDANSQDFSSKCFNAVAKLAKLIKIAKKQMKKVYIHCTAGMYRSPQIVVLYLVLYRRYSLSQGLKQVKEKHLFAEPNEKLLTKILKDWNDKKLRK